MIDLKALHLHWRVSHYKGTTYRSYSLAHAYRHNGTNRKDIVLKLGKLSDEEAGRWRELLQAAKTPHTFFTTLHDLTVTHRYAYLDVAVANTVWQAWQLDTVFRPPGKRALSLATMARILTLNRCIDPAAQSKTPDWFRDTALPWLLAIPTEFGQSLAYLSGISRHRTPQDSPLPASVPPLGTRAARDDARRVLRLVQHHVQRCALYADEVGALQGRLPQSCGAGSGGEW